MNDATTNSGTVPDINTMLDLKNLIDEQNQEMHEECKRIVSAIFGKRTEFDFNKNLLVISESFNEYLVNGGYTFPPYMNVKVKQDSMMGKTGAMIVPIADTPMNYSPFLDLA